MPLHLGPLGALHTMRSPRVDIPIEYPRQGGVHTALSGATTVDYLGARGKFEFKWAHLPEADAEYLLALRDRHVRGPLRFVLDGWRRNRLGRSAASLGYGGRDLDGVAVTSGMLGPARQWPLQAPPAGLGLQWSGYTAGSVLRLDRGRPAPMLPGETLTCSVWVWGSHTETVRLDADHYGASGYTSTTTGPALALVAGQWQRLTLTVPAAAAVWAVSPSVTAVDRASADSTIVLAAAQVEPGSSASAWSLGGGAPAVAVDEVPLAIPRAGYLDPELHLMEV
ncbi:hypothetical protein SAMN02982929_05299 [Saccharopolyspora kobensis]|uniref:Uncharacterized protein n=1 Tax=Saccharopolyspora kobensis TaxID=146035 RepID=A0A1H6E021_9PSEU|nr:hypothetical protein [Saccharopolyspora kobensis]SEG90719.1 hypothetical protein SAMN02982929_05299 [Saccharopolyspora kobensis]SFD93418.1 hypothetical protein SAMN05216506_107275 [Saccharopolyspora kobensis]